MGIRVVVLRRSKGHQYFRSHTHTRPDCLHELTSSDLTRLRRKERMREKAERGGDKGKHELRKESLGLSGKEIRERKN